jgi:hypothetical protein
MIHSYITAENTICPHCLKGHLLITPENYPYNIEHLMCNHCYSTYPLEYKPMYMEDVRNIALSAIDVITQRLSEFGVKLSDENVDKIYNTMWDELERACPNDYKHHH